MAKAGVEWPKFRDSVSEALDAVAKLESVTEGLEAASAKVGLDAFLKTVLYSNGAQVGDMSLTDAQEAIAAAKRITIEADDLKALHWARSK